MSTSEIKMRAKHALDGQWGLAIAVILVASLLESCSASLRGVGAALLAGPVGVGVCSFFLRLIDRDSPIFSDLFDGFRSFINCFIAGLLQSILVTVFTMLLVIPGIIKALAYSQAYFILAEHPDLDGWAALKASERLMNGHKEELLMLWLSFIPWLLLCVFVFPILYVGPFFSASMAQFYRNISHELILD